MTSMVEALRASRKNPSVLKLKILKVRGEDPNVLIFCYEGPDDVPVYEEWMARLANCPRYEPLAGAGKQQLVSLHRLLSESADPLLEKVFFFVDRDFDLQLATNPHIYELDAYSIENLLCTEEVLESLLKDEFKLAGALSERAIVRTKFREIKQQFIQCCLPVHFMLFAAQRTKSQVIKKPEKISDLVNISVDSIAVAYENLTDIVVVQPNVPGHVLDELRAEFDALHILFKERGKYVVEMFRRWLRELAVDLKSPTPVLFTVSNSRLAGDPGAVSLRRLASSVAIPPSLSHFMKNLIDRTSGVA